LTALPRLGRNPGSRTAIATREPKTVLPRSELRAFAEQAAEKYAVDPALVHSVIEVESNYNPLAVSPKGAQGIMQLTPETAARLAVKNAFDPWQNIDGGVRYLKYLLEMFDSEPLALAAYNAGEGAVVRHGGIPPYPETTWYINQVARKRGQAKRVETGTQAAAEAGPGWLPIEEFVDTQGNLHLRTRPEP
jgi:soluble lytic murein transglycosylase-like protein